MAKVLGDKQAEADGSVPVREIIEVDAGRVREAIEDQGEKEHIESSRGQVYLLT